MNELILPRHDNLEAPVEPVMVGSRVLVKKIKREMSKHGIILPQTNSAAAGSEGEVVAIGPGILLQSGQRLPLSVRVGDRVIIGPRVIEIEIDEQRYYVVDEGDILAILR